MAADGLSKAKEYFNEHRKRLNEFHKRGVLLMAGPLANPSDGAIGIFTNSEAAKEFISGDPFIINGAVENYKLVEWNEVLAV